MPTGFEVLSLLVLTLGVVLSIWEGSIAGSPTGICIAVASTFCGAAMLSFSGKVPSTCAPLQACQSVRRNMPLDIHHWPLLAVASTVCMLSLSGSVSSSVPMLLSVQIRVASSHSWTSKWHGMASDWQKSRAMGVHVSGTASAAQGLTGHLHVHAGAEGEDGCAAADFLYRASVCGHPGAVLPHD